MRDGLQVPTDVRRPTTIAALLCVAVLLLGTFQLAGFLYFAHQTALRNKQIGRLQGELAQAQAALFQEGKALAGVHRLAVRIVKNRHATLVQLRHLEQRSRPLVVASPSPGPTVTATTTATVTRRVHPSSRRSRHRAGSEPSPSCTTVQVLNRCQTVPPIRLG